ncbi:Hypothetical protein, putative [Bodo saltans]|uniref:Uncharacterized protein n=1 Tax=Bodo saltans TaxID=75058 RepID=A0A0S4J2A1_BODSA|nr:Hypothetical protein, putative [Bodo saltans]|eukprot:CUG19143.1 Hypothetical protein, putative [Bodo saltans]
MGATCSSMCCEGPTVAYPLHRGGQNCVVVRNQFRSKQHRANSGGSSPRKAHRVPACIVASNDEVAAPSQSGAATTSATVEGMTTRLADGSSGGTLLLGPGHSVLLQVAAHHQRNGSGGDHMLRVAPVTKLELKAPLLCPSTAEASPTSSPRAHMPPRDDIFEPTENKLSNPFEPPVRWPRTTLAPRSSWSGDCSADEIPGNPSSGNNNNTNARKTSPSNGRWFTPAAAGGAVMSVTSPTNQQVSVTEQQQRAAPRIRELSVSFSFQRVNLLGNDGDAEDFGDLHSAPEERSESRMQSGHAASVDELLMPVGQPFSPGAPLDRCNTAAGLNDAFGDE